MSYVDLEDILPDDGYTAEIPEPPESGLIIRKVQTPSGLTIGSVVPETYYVAPGFPAWMNDRSLLPKAPPRKRVRAQ